ncbi:hypothetical protein [Humibacter ginsenosidimutans]|uniref:Uncharacterized protein n=1 Tax=Humibacter ginsenosidimutans TaxID=2599293 RepID=A0A5B8M0K4_9MICO|nr:hypothetical protein [Humibacter ginsenosidimutans]QDZ14207.1 hypothetical protein FPZ11_04995 [Humibacter ginsenosidimutans]
MTLKPGRRASMWLPYRDDPGANFRWLKGVCGERTRPEYNRQTKEFEVAREHTQLVIDALVVEYRRVHVVQYGHARTTCVEACWNARLSTIADCVCGCAGANHGSGKPFGREVQAGLSVANELTCAEFIVTRKGWELRKRF